MRGIKLDELCSLVSTGHEAEFVYRSDLYVIQSEVQENESFLTIWTCGKNAHCICKQLIPVQGKIQQSVIDKVFNEKCFDGKSFYEIESEITVNNIF